MSENERLREVLKRVSGELHYQTTPRGINHYSICKITAIIDKALYTEPDTCVWRHNDYGYHTGCPQGVWLSSELLHIIGCYIEDGLNAIVYCPGCGCKIEVMDKKW